MDEKNVKLKLAYDGTGYHGWQRQKNGLTVQELLEEKISTMINGPVTVHGSGRTDAGVHALGQVCNFKHRTRLEPGHFKNGLNSMLPCDIFVLEASSAPESFHSRYSAKAKTYEYRILNTPEPDIFLRRYVWHVPCRLDPEAVRDCLAVLEGRRDFSSFQSAGSFTRDPVRNLYRAEVTTDLEGLLRVVLEADGFLRHMVRNIVGTVINAVRGGMGPGDIVKILEARDRTAAGVKAPAGGLFLVEVSY